MLAQGKDDNLRQRLLTVGLLQELKEIYTYKELSEILNIQESVLCRYVNGNRIPSEKQCSNIMLKVRERIGISQLLRNQIKIFEDGFIDVSKLLFFPNLLRSYLTLVLESKLSNNIDKVIGIASNGLPFATFVSSIYNVPLIIAKKHKDSVFLRYLEENIKESNSVISPIYIREDLIKKNDKVLIVDDVLRTGKTFSALSNLAAKAGAKIEAAVIIASSRENISTARTDTQIITLFKL
jgi:purine operon repressor